MMKVYNDNIKPEFINFDKVAIGDTFCVIPNSGICPVYIKTAHASADNNYNNCICLNDGRITRFYADEPVRLIDCELKWKFRDVKDKFEVL